MSQETQGATVERVTALGLPAVHTQIAIAVDTAYVATQGGGPNLTTGVYMFDNHVAHGSTGEGTLELSTVCATQDLIGFSVYPINQLGGSGDSVAITGFTVSQGNVFGSAGNPIQQTPSYWIGQATSAGQQTYQIRMLVTIGGLRPTKYAVSWDPFITAR